MANNIKYNTETDKDKRSIAAILNVNLGGEPINKDSKKDKILDIIGVIYDFSSGLQKMNIISMENTPGVKDTILGAGLYHLVVMSLKDDHSDIEKFTFNQLNEMLTKINVKKDEIADICLIGSFKTGYLRKHNIGDLNESILAKKLSNFFNYAIDVLKILDF